MIEPEFASVLKASAAGDLDPVADAALRLGRPAARDPDPHRPSPRDQRAYRADRPHHPGRAAPPHHHDRARQRLPQPHPLVACRRQRLLPEGGHHDPLAGTGLTGLLAADSQARPNRWRCPPGPRRSRSLARRLPPARPTSARRARPDHRPRRGAHDPARAPIHPRRRQTTDRPSTPPSGDCIGRPSSPSSRTRPPSHSTRWCSGSQRSPGGRSARSVLASATAPNDSVDPAELFRLAASRLNGD